MKKSSFKISALVLVIFMMLPLCFACGEKADTGGSGTATEAPAGDDTATETTPEETTPAPTTTKATEPQTEAPTDPAERPAPDELGIIAGFRYYIANANSKLYLENYSKKSGGQPTQEEFSGKTTQMYVFEPQGDGIYKIKSLNSNCWFDVDYVEGEAVTGKYITITEAQITENSQLFRIIKNEDETYTFVSMLSTDEATVSVTVKSVSTDAGGEIILWKGTTAKHQKWTLELAADKPAA